MYRLIHAIICAYLASTTLSGCVGLGVSHPEECKFQPPTIKKLDAITNDFVLDNWSKEMFLNEWGKPDEVINVSSNEEIWVYKRSQWCGVTPVIILPIPLMLPVCDGFDRITFNGDKSTSRHARAMVADGIVIIIPLYFFPFNSFYSAACYDGLFEKNFIDLTEAIKSGATRK